MTETADVPLLPWKPQGKMQDLQSWGLFQDLGFGVQGLACGGFGVGKVSSLGSEFRWEWHAFAWLPATAGGYL